MGKIIDFEKKGQTVRFYIGADDCEDYWGDDWDDAPYEHNAEEVYSEYVIGINDVTFPFDDVVVEPADDWSYRGNTPYSKDDMKNRRVPCIVHLDAKSAKEYYDPSFIKCLADDKSEKFYFGDPMEATAPYEV